MLFTMMKIIVYKGKRGITLSPLTNLCVWLVTTFGLLENVV